MTNPVKILLGNLKTILSFGSTNANKNVVTDANGDLVTENKNNHSHGNISSTGTLSGTSKNVVTDSSGNITTENKPTIPTKVSDLTNDSGFITKTNVYYGTCDTAAGTQVKVVTVTGWEFITGNILFVKFTDNNTYNGTAQLSINSTTKDVATYGTTKTSRYFWKAGELVGFVYDGTNMLMLEQGTATTTYYGTTKLSSSTTSTSESVAATPKAVKTTYDLANGKADATHSHTVSDVTDFPSTMTPSSHTHTKSEITDFPTSMTPASHTHGDITNDGKLGTTSGKPLITTTGGKIATGTFGTSSGQFAEGNHNHDGTYLKSYTPPTGSTSQAGILQLEDSYSSTSTTKAATPNAVKAAYDKGNHSHSSYVNPTIADNLTTNDATQVLSAKQGKVLQDNKLDATTAASTYQPKGTYLTSHQSLSDIGGAVTITKATNSTDNTLTTYTIKQGGATLTNGVIDIPKKGVDVGTFTELQTLIDNASNNDIIILTKDYKNSGNEDYITITKPLTIIGNGHIIDGDKKNGIITLSAYGSCKFNGIVFVNGDFAVGGAIWVNTSDNIISNCSFINNNSTNGGALAIASSNNTIHNCEFINNTATNGGAINIAYSATPIINNTIYNCVFRYNSATNGANIYNSSSAITIYDCHITTGLDNAVNKDSVYIDDVNSSISTHNSSNSAHQDIRDLIPNVSGKADITQSITNGDTTHSPSADIIYDTLIDSNSTTKNGHTHNYATSNDISSSISTHNSNSSAHSDIRQSIPSASSVTPSADTTNGVIGSSSNYAKADHQHPLSSAYATSGHSHSGMLTTSDVGTSSDTSSSKIVACNDTRLSDARTPTSHTHTYSNITNVSTVAVVVTYTDDTTETLNLLKYTGS